MKSETATEGRNKSISDPGQLNYIGKCKSNSSQPRKGIETYFPNLCWPFKAQPDKTDGTAQVQVWEIGKKLG